MARILEYKVDTKPYRKLAELEAARDKLTDEIEELRAELLLPTQRVGRVVIPGYMFEVNTRATYAFSNKVFELAGLLKARKAYEVEKKIAKPGIPSTFLTMKAV